MKKMIRNIASALLFAAAIFTCAMPATAGQKTLRFAVTDIEGLEMLQREFGAFKDLLSKKMGVDIELYPVPNRTAAVEAMRSKNIDFVLTGPSEYVVFRTLSDAVPVVGLSRPDYFCSIIVMADSGINNIKDLKGKKMAIGPVGSTSKHLAPIQIVADNGLNPLKDLQILHTSIDLGWQALKQRDVQAWGMTTDKFNKLRGKEKDFEPGAFKVIARGPDLPNDVLLAGKHVDKNLVKKMKTAFSKSSAEFVAAILVGSDNKKYEGMKFIPEIKDADYNYVRSMYRTAGYTKFSQFPE